MKVKAAGRLSYVPRMEPFEGSGIFWPAGDENQQVAGRITYTPTEGVSVEVVGGFGNAADMFTVASTVEGQRIHGFAAGRRLTLESCYRTNSTIHMPGVQLETWHCGTALVGALWPADESLTFDEFTVEFDQLPNWLGRSGIEVKTQQPAEPPNHMASIDAKLTSIDDDAFEIPNGTVLSVGSGWSLGGDHITETKIGQNHYLGMKYPTPQPLDAILGDVNCLQDLVTLGADAPALPTAVILLRPDVTQDLGEGASIPTRIELLRAYAEEPTLNPQSRHLILFGYQAIGAIESVAKWLAIARDYRPALGLLFSIRYGGRMYVENRFQNVVNAAETLHRMSEANEIMPPDTFKAMRKSIVSAAPRMHREWLGNQLQYSNEPRLKHRLTRLAELAGSDLDWLVGDREKWVAIVVEARNRLTHREGKGPVAIDSEHLFFLVESVFLCVALALFALCGIETSTLSETNNQRVHFLQRRLATIVPEVHDSLVASKHGAGDA